jgi:hypothetical protein
VLRKKAGKAAVGMEFWVAQMTPAEVDDFKDVGAIPRDA